MNQPPASVYQFGPFQYDPAQRLLFREGQAVPLGPKSIDTLHALLDRRGQVVEKAELMKLVWPDCVVEEIGLARNISLLRKALGDDAEKYIETVPRRGYRFAAEILESAAATASPAPVRRLRLSAIVVLLVIGGFAMGALIYWQFYRPSRYLPRRGPSASLAVVSFDCLNGDLERESFCRGLTESLVSQIAKLESVDVISPSTVDRYRQLRIPAAIMSRLLGLEVVVEGTAQKIGSGVRVTVRLTDVHSGRLIWADNYDLPAADPGHSAVRAIAGEIGRRLSN